MIFKVVFVNQVFDTCSLGNVLLKFQFFHHIISSFFVCLFCCDHILMVCFAHAFFPAVSTKSHQSVITLTSVRVENGSLCRLAKFYANLYR